MEVGQGPNEGCSAKEKKSGNINVITLIVCDAALLVILMGKIYDRCC
jgi:hypothetical protein